MFLQEFVVAIRRIHNLLTMVVFQDIFENNLLSAALLDGIDMTELASLVILSVNVLPVFSLKFTLN